MNASELIKRLKELIDKHGDLELIDYWGEPVNEVHVSMDDNSSVIIIE